MRPSSGTPGGGRFRLPGFNRERMRIAPIPRRSQLAAERQVMWMDTQVVVMLVLGVASLIIALVTLTIKLIELGRK
jgi:hypothetical protein